MLAARLKKHVLVWRDEHPKPQGNPRKTCPLVLVVGTEIHCRLASKIHAPYV